MNTELLLKVADAIEKEELASFDMRDWYRKRGPDHCKTTACIAGFTAMLIGADMSEPYRLRTFAEQALEGGPSIATRELFFANSMNERAGDRLIRDSLDVISLHYTQHVPAALRWMVENNQYNWREAFKALGVCKS